MAKHELLTLQNVGKATLKDLELLDITSIQQLAKADPDELFHRLGIIKGSTQNPCNWDVFAAIIHEAKTGEKTPWWEWSKVRGNKFEKHKK
ncbi:MAG: Mitomycin resistance protein mcrB [Candidatus Amoebophilus sp. 36-38]|nr:MAG: Mitomycin resistance protein mcrB [Candidatus Amoebophilus sp. 36-38]